MKRLHLVVAGVLLVALHVVAASCTFRQEQRPDAGGACACAGPPGDCGEQFPAYIRCCTESDCWLPADQAIPCGPGPLGDWQAQCGPDGTCAAVCAPDAG